MTAGICSHFIVIKSYAKNGFAMAYTCSLVKGSSNASDAALADIILPPIFTIFTPAYMVPSSPS